MKKVVLNKIKIFALVFTSLFMLPACEDMLNSLTDKDTGEDMTLLLLDLNFFETRFTLHFIDRQTGEHITDRPIRVHLLGEHAHYIVDFEGFRNDSYTVNNGRLRLNVDPEFEVSSSNPLDFEVIAIDDERTYVAPPTEVFISTKGFHNRNIRFVNLGSMKAHTKASGKEPFDMLFNGVLIGSENDPDWRIHKVSFLQEELSFHRYFSTWQTEPGVLSTDNFTGDPNLIERWGFTGYYTEWLPNSINVSTFKVMNPNEVQVPPGAHYVEFFTVTEPKGTTKCNEGINIQVNGAAGQSGSAEFKYTLLINEEVVSEERMTISSLPATINTGRFYYPVDASNVVMRFEGDGQFEVSPSEIVLSGPCNQTVQITATRKSGLVPHQLIAQFQCAENNYAVSPTVDAKFRIQGSSEPWTHFTLFEGNATVMLKPGETYTVAAEFGNREATFDIPTDVNKIDEVIARALSEYTQLSNISSSVETKSDGTVVVRAKVYFKPGECPAGI